MLKQFNCNYLLLTDVSVSFEFNNKKRLMMSFEIVNKNFSIELDFFSEIVLKSSQFSRVENHPKTPSLKTRYNKNAALFFVNELI